MQQFEVTEIWEPGTYGACLYSEVCREAPGNCNKPSWNLTKQVSSKDPNTTKDAKVGKI